MMKLSGPYHVACHGMCLSDKIMRPEPHHAESYTMKRYTKSQCNVSSLKNVMDYFIVPVPRHINHIYHYQMVITFCDRINP